MARRLLSGMTDAELAVERGRVANASGKAARIRFGDILSEEIRREDLAAYLAREGQSA